MNGIGNVSPVDTAAAAVERAQNEDTSQAIAVLKKAINLEKDMIQELLPMPSGRLDIRV
jgi:hypothetical protein